MKTKLLTYLSACFLGVCLGLTYMGLVCAYISN